MEKKILKKLILSSLSLVFLFSGFAASYSLVSADKWTDKLDDTDIAVDPSVASKPEEAASQMILNILQTLAVVFGGLFLVMMLVGAIIYMTSADSGRKDMGKNIMVLAVVGAVIGLLVAVIWLFLKDTFGK